MKKSFLIGFLIGIALVGVAWAVDTKLSALTELAEAPAEADELYINDGGTSKKITALNLMKALQSALTSYEIHYDNIPTRYKVVTKTTSLAYTIGTTNAYESYGGIVYVTGAATITAPAIADGMNFTVITVGAYAVSLDVNAADRMILDGTALIDGNRATNPSTTGSSITCAYESSSGWYCGSGSNNGTLWTDGGA
jgi:hypothetical protein